MIKPLALIKVGFMLQFPLVMPSQELKVNTTIEDTSKNQLIDTRDSKENDLVNFCVYKNDKKVTIKVDNYKLL